jgi:uncharacterized membrane protein
LLVNTSSRVREVLRFLFWAVVLSAPAAALLMQTTAQMGAP